MDDPALLYVWRRWSEEVLPRMPFEDFYKHPRSFCVKECQFFTVKHGNKNFTVCKLSGQVHICPGYECMYRIIHPKEGTEICSASGLVMEQKLDAISSVYMKLTSLQPDPQGLLGTFIGDVGVREAVSASAANTQRIVNAQSKRHGALDVHDRVDAKISAVRTIRDVHAQVSKSLAPGPSPLLQNFSPESVAHQTMVASASLRAILVSGYETRVRRMFNRPTPTSIRHAVVDRFQQQFQIPSLRGSFDVLRAVDAAVRVFLDCNRRPPLHVAVIRASAVIPPVDEKVVMRVARFCANLFPCMQALDQVDEPRRAEPNFALHCMALTRQLVDGIVHQGVELLPSIPILALWLPATDAIVATMSSTTQKDLTQTIGRLNTRLVNLHTRYKIDPAFWANEQCRAWPPGMPLPF